MVKLTKLNGTEFTVNAELIESLEGSPNSTVVNLASNNRFIVKEPPEVIVELICAYRRKIYSEGKVLNPIQGFERD